MLSGLLVVTAFTPSPPSRIEGEDLNTATELLPEAILVREGGLG